MPLVVHLGGTDSSAEEALANVSTSLLLCTRLLPIDKFLALFQPVLVKHALFVQVWFGTRSLL